MRKAFRFTSVVALIAATVSACEKEQGTEDVVSSGVEINIVADGSISPDSKTAAVDGTIPSVKWLSTDQLTVYEIVDGAVNQTTTTTSTTLTDGDYTASFKATIPGNDPSGSSYKYAAVYPSTAVSEGGSAPNNFFRLTMPNEQTLIGNNFSANSDILISEVFDHGDTRVTSSESISFKFKRVGTAVKLTLKGITADEKIKRVEITAPHFIAGRVKYVRETSSLVTDSWHYSGQGQSTITLNVDNLTATGNDVLWFRVLAAEKWANGENLSIAVETDKANYYRNGIDGDHAAITLGKDIDFVDGGLTAFGVNLGSYRVAKPTATTYTLVEDNANIMNGAEYLVVYTAGSKAMGTYGSSLYTPTDVTIDNKQISITSESVTIVTLEDAGSGSFYMKVGNNDYLYWDSGNTVKHGAKGATDYYKWTITKDAVQNCGDNTRKLQYNTSSPRFACYTGTQKDVSLYVNELTLVPSLATPTVLAEIQNTNEIYVTWNDVANADSYTVTCTGETDQVIGAGVEEATFSGLSDGTYTITVTAVSNNPSSYQNSAPAVVENLLVGAPKGTINNPYTASEARDLALNGDTGSYYISGIVTKIQNQYSASYGTANFWIDENGTDQTVFEGYKIKYFDDVNWVEGNAEIALNDDVIIYGTLTVYKTTTAETSSGYLVSLNGKTKGLTLAAPTITTNDSAKQITVAWTAATGTESAVSYVINCGTQSYNATAAGSHTFTMADYGTYSVSVEATASDAVAATINTSATLTDPNAGTPTVYTIEWGSSYNSASVSDYTSTWDATKDGFKVNMANFNNNQNGWDYVKCGRKNNTSVATIITDAAITEAIKTVTITIDALTASKINSITLYVSSSKDSGWTSAGTFTKATGNQSVTIASPAANKYYKLEFDCASGSSNGLLTLSKAVFSTN